MSAGYSASDNNQLSNTALTHFIPLGKVGTGTFSSVYKVRRVSDGKIYALKKVRLGTLSTRQKENALNEVRILASIASKNIVSYKQAFFDQKLQLLCIVMEYADGGDLSSLIKDKKKFCENFTEDQIWKITYQLVCGLVKLHETNVLHRDVKPANIFISDKNIKLGDLNVSKVKKQSLVFTQTGTPSYASPQIWKSDPYNEKSDIWSLGCVIYQLCMLKTPFKGRNLDELFVNIQKVNYEPISLLYSQKLRNFINFCLKKNPNSRPSSYELLSYIPPIYQTFEHEKRNKQSMLLETIKLPTDLGELNHKLPKSNYESKKKAISPIKKQSVKKIGKIVKNGSYSQKQIRSTQITKNVTQPQIEIFPGKLIKKINLVENLQNKKNNCSSQRVQKDLPLAKLYPTTDRRDPNYHRHKSLDLLNRINKIVPRPKSYNYLREQNQQVCPNISISNLSEKISKLQEKLRLKMNHQNKLKRIFSSPQINDLNSNKILKKYPQSRKRGIYPYIF